MPWGGRWRRPAARRGPGRARPRSPSWRPCSRGGGRSPRRARRPRRTWAGGRWRRNASPRAGRCPRPTAPDAYRPRVVGLRTHGDVDPARVGGVVGRLGRGDAHEVGAVESPDEVTVPPLSARHAAMRADSPNGTQPARTWLVAADSTAYAAASSASSPRSRGRTDTSMLMRDRSGRRTGLLIVPQATGCGHRESPDRASPSPLVATLEGWRIASSRRPSRRSTPPT